MDKVDVVNFIDKVKEIDIIIGREKKEPLESEKLFVIPGAENIEAASQGVTELMELIQ